MCGCPIRNYGVGKSELTYIRDATTNEAFRLAPKMHLTGLEQFDTHPSLRS